MSDRASDTDGQEPPIGAALLGHAPSLRRFFAARRLPPDEIDDSVQEVYARVLATIEQDGEPAGRPANLGGFLHRIAQNLLTDRHRRGRSRQQHLHVPLDGELPIPDGALEDLRHPERALAGRQMLGIARDALAELDPVCRQVFLLARFDRCSHAQIAERLGLTQVQVGRLVAKALTHLNRSMRSRT